MWSLGWRRIEDRVIVEVVWDVVGWMERRVEVRVRDVRREDDGRVEVKRGG